MLTYGDAVSDVNIKKLVEFHKEKKTLGTVTGVYPPSRFGDLVVEDSRVIKFKEKLKDIENQSPINGGFFVFKKAFLNLIEDNPAEVLEEKPMNKLVEKSELSVFRHKGFWQCMDTFRDFEMLNEMWRNNPKWKIWS